METKEIIGMDSAYICAQETGFGNMKISAGLVVELIDRLRESEEKKGDLLYKKPVYQHSFTVDGHTFYADNEVDILYLERKFGVGGKAKLEVVKDE